MKHLLLGLGALAALAACGGGGSSPAAPQPPPPTTTLAPATLADLSAVTTSPQANAKVGCRSPIRAEVRLTNAAALGVVILGVERSTRVISGNCFTAETYTHNPAAPSVPAHQTVTVFDGALFGDRSGCCRGGRGCTGTCTFEESFKVSTRVGDVPAGQFRHQVEFKGCSLCQEVGASSAFACPPAGP